jgi:hypothetical protein
MTATMTSQITRFAHQRPDVRRFQRIVAAAVLLVPATTVAIGRLVVTDDSDTRKALDLIASDPGHQFTFALLGFLAILTVVPAFLAAARLARRRRPLLTMIALGVNLVAYLGGWALAPSTTCTWQGACSVLGSGTAPRPSSTRCGQMGWPASAPCSWSSATFSARS